MTQYRITFRAESKPENIQIVSVSGGTSLSNAAAQAGIDLRTHCGGTGLCGKCQVIVNRQTVLACQTNVENDLDVFVPNTSLRTNEQHVYIPADTTIPHKLHLQQKYRQDHRFGIALDIGTTTLAAELHDFTGKPMQTASCVNPQRSFGDDVITRIHKVMENPSTLTALQQSVTDSVNAMIAEMTGKAGITPQDISIMIAAGNTVMQSLFFGIDPSPLGESPFHAPVETFPVRKGSELGLVMAAEATVEMFPIFGGFVGGDIAAGVLTLPKLFQPNHSHSSAPQFLLDIGTNGEIVLAKGNELFTAATAAGPAFEGAGIEYGTLAVPGAIDHVEFLLGQISVSTIGNKPAIGLCGSGLIDAVAVLLEQGIILPSGRFADKRSSYELVTASVSGIGEPILLTQRDIRELQLAAGAIRAGITLLLQEYKVQAESLETFYVAGGFGQSIRLSSARRIGLLPALLPERFQFCGNTSLSGARALLLNPENTEMVNCFVRQSHHCELAMLPQFQQVFAESMRWG